MPQKRKPKTKKRVAKRKPTQVKKRIKKSRAVLAPVSYSSSTKASAPNVSGSKGQIRIKHKELINGAITGSAAWTLFQTIVVNPGISATFPWLSTQSANWEMYKFNSLHFQYITRCSTATPGSIALVPEYNVLDDAPTTEQQTTTYQDMKEDSVWKNFSIACKTSNMSSGRTKHFIRTSVAPAGSSLVDYDVAKLYIATNDGVDATKWGKLWVEYDVTLFTPQTAIPAAFSDFLVDAPRAEGQYTVATYSSTGNMSNPIPYNTIAGLNGGMEVSDLTSTGYRYMTFPWEGYYHISFTIECASKNPAFNNSWPASTVGGGVTDRFYTNWLDTTNYTMGWFVLGVGDGKAGNTNKPINVTVDFANLVAIGTGGTSALVSSMVVSYTGSSPYPPAPLPPVESKHRQSLDDDDDFVSITPKSVDAGLKTTSSTSLSVGPSRSMSRPLSGPATPPPISGKGNGSSSRFSMAKH